MDRLDGKANNGIRKVKMTSKAYLTWSQPGLTRPYKDGKARWKGQIERQDGKARRKG
jgi:hypothetical protein